MNLWLVLLSKRVATVIADTKVPITHPTVVVSGKEVAVPFKTHVSISYRQQILSTGGSFRTRDPLMLDTGRGLDAATISSK